MHTCHQATCCNPNHLYLEEEFVSRFWAKASRGGPEECWLWTGHRNGDGYGKVRRGRRMDGAHRVAWTLTYGAIREEMEVCHRCDALYPAGDITYRRCVNPAHLFLGTHAENMADMAAKGRQQNMRRGDAHWTRQRPERIARGDRHGSKTRPERVPRGDRSGRRTHPERTARGERCGNVSLTSAQVVEIRRRYAVGGITQLELAREYGVARPTISHVVAGRHWRHITQGNAPADDPCQDRASPDSR
jgi:uncharacterized C2H2 Zn-finger protein